MTRRGKIAERQGNALARLRANAPGGPDPRFRAVLRERLVSAAGGDHQDHGRVVQDHARAGGAREDAD